ncbi:hypothetical protein IV203_006196 [Nitzschia inconspicua]|uniref:Uncharacterized protein n=1 Tax=Nitzschia inconspicua TaxID=303405 RepID=A0A9K3PGT4_9STRA|nr:hypothetical protein IV203_006196 [Nitzschia inconspicua]
MTPMSVEGPNIILRNDRKRTVRASPAKIGKGDGNDSLGSRWPLDARCNSNVSCLSAGLCNLDVINWKECLHPQCETRQRNQRRQLGEALLRNKAFGDQSHHGELLYRKRESFLSEEYANCMFLDLYDTVMAVDCNGTMNVVKITGLSNKIRPGSSNVKNVIPAAKVKTFDLSQILPIDGFSSLYLAPLAEGNTVALGTKDKLLFLDVEQSSAISPAVTSVLLPVRSTQTHFRSWTVPTPRRQFYRDRHNPLLTLHQIAKTRLGINNFATLSDSSELQCIHLSPDNTTSSHSCRIPNQIHFLPHLQPSNASRWSVCEMYSGLSPVVQVAHVDSDYDAFSIQLLDKRTKGRPTVFVDSTSKDSPGSIEEHITTIACVSDICVATAHISCPNFGLTKARDFFDRDLAYSGQGMMTCVKLWDLRVMSSSESVSMNAARIVSLPSFPQNEVILMEPVECIPSYMTTDGRSTMKKSMLEGLPDSGSPGSGGSDFIMTGLTSSSGSDGVGRCNNGSTSMGSLVATVQSRSRPGSLDHHKLDLGTFDVKGTVSQACHNTGGGPFYAFSSSLDYLVCKTTNDKEFTLDIHDMTGRKNTSLSPRRSGKKKRLVDRFPSYRIEPEMTDRYGARSILSCITMNQNGTSVLCGTTDGDLFVWHGF